jgi:hypothetical protein
MQGKRALFVLFAFPLLAQQTVATGEFSIAGAVVNSVTGERIKQALVQLTPAAARGARKTAFADAAGTFRFSGLPAGSYTITARKPHFAPSSPGVSITLSASREDISLPLEPLAVIKGRVLDSYGDPLSGILVHALQPRMENGHRHLEMLRWARSHDRGDYRLWDLAPGRYYVKVVGRSAATMLYVGERRPPAPDEAFAPVYYGGGPTAAAALPLTVAPGGEVQADFTLAVQPGRSIIGAVINAVPYRPAQIQLLSGDEDVGETRAVFNLADGRFRIQDLVDGAYTLRITQGEGSERTRAVETVEVAGRDIQGLIVRLAPGITVKGKVRVEGELPTGIRGLYRVSLTPRDAPDRSRQQDYSAQVDEILEFAIPSVLAGRYRVSMFTPIGYVASITSGDRDLLPDGEMTVVPDEPPAPLEIVVRTDGGQVTGSIVVDGRPAAAIVALVPVSGSSRDVVTRLAFQAGSFAFRNVPPGEYRVQAWKRDAEPEYANPEVLRALSNLGERLQVTPNGKHKLDLAAFSEVTP